MRYSGSTNGELAGDLDIVEGQLDSLYSSAIE